MQAWFALKSYSLSLSLLSRVMTIKILQKWALLSHHSGKSICIAEEGWQNIQNSGTVLEWSLVGLAVLVARFVIAWVTGRMSWVIAEMNHQETILDSHRIYPTCLLVDGSGLESNSEPHWGSDCKKKQHSGCLQLKMNFLRKSWFVHSLDCQNSWEGWNCDPRWLWVPLKPRLWGQSCPH